MTSIIPFTPFFGVVYKTQMNDEKYNKGIQL